MGSQETESEKMQRAPLLLDRISRNWETEFSMSIMESHKSHRIIG